jgi:hypothetical protein
VLYVFIMYFTYAQLFVILLIRSMYTYIKSRIKGQSVSWDKTQRFKQKAM